MIQCDAYDLADWYRAQGQHQAEVCVRAELAAAAGDPLDNVNLLLALCDAGYLVEVSWLAEQAARFPEWDPMFANTLEMLALEADDPAEACAILAQVDYLREIHYGQDTDQKDASQVPTKEDDDEEESDAQAPQHHSTRGESREAERPGRPAVAALGLTRERPAVIQCRNERVVVGEDGRRS